MESLIFPFEEVDPRAGGLAGRQAASGEVSTTRTALSSRSFCPWRLPWSSPARQHYRPTPPCQEHPRVDADAERAAPAGGSEGQVGPQSSTGQHAAASLLSILRSWRPSSNVTFMSHPSSPAPRGCPQPGCPRAKCRSVGRGTAASLPNRSSRSTLLSALHVWHLARPLGAPETRRIFFH